MAEEYIAIILLGISLIYFFIKLSLELDPQHHPLKLFLIWLAFIAMMPVTNLGMEIAVDATMSADVITNMSTIYYIVWVVFLVGTAYFGIFVFRTTLEYLAGSDKRPFKREK